VRDRLVLVACILASSLTGMDGLMTTTALPAMAETFDVGLAVQQWIVAGFLLALGSLLLVGGALGDLYGRWRIFGLGAVASGLAVTVCALAPNPALLLVGRLLQGMAAALLLPSVLAVLTRTYEGERRSKAIASWSAWSGLSVIAGPIVGGLLIDALSWRAIYWVQVPFAALVVVLIYRAAPRQEERAVATGRVDLGGALLAVLAIGGPVFFVIQGSNTGWTNPLVVAALVAGLAALVLFVWWERRAATPLLPLSLFRIRRFTLLNVVTFVLYGGLIACGTYTVLFLQDGLRFHPAVAGVVSAVPIIVLFARSGRFGALADRFGGTVFVAAGLIVAGLGMLLLLRVDAVDDLFTLVLPSTLIHGLGLAMLVAPLTAGVMSAVPGERAGIASGINNAVARTGSMAAIAVIGVLISLQFSASLEHALEGKEAGQAVRQAVEQARQHPFSTTPRGRLSPAERTELEPILSTAAVDAFRSGMAVTAGLALTAGVIAFAGLRHRPRPRYDAAGTIGCPITGARTHLDAVAPPAHRE
jgi:EmrB/QacA subfamily drug resistance transporter